MDAEGAGNIFTGDVVDTISGALDLELQRVGHLSANHLLGFVAVKLHLATEKEIGVQISEHQIGVREGCAITTLVVTSRPG